LGRKKELEEKSQEVFQQSLLNDFSVIYDAGGSIGRRYRRQDEIGTPLAITIDFQSLEDETVTCRNRESMKQVRVPITQLPTVINQLIA